MKNKQKKILKRKFCSFEMRELSFRIIDLGYIYYSKKTHTKPIQKNKNSHQNKTLIKNKNPHQRGEGLV